MCVEGFVCQLLSVEQSGKRGVMYYLRPLSGASFVFLELRDFDQGASGQAVRYVSGCTGFRTAELDPDTKSSL